MNQIEEYRDALDGLRFSEAGKERIVKNLMEQEGQSIKGKHFRPLRPALIAACVCLALVGTVGAAKYFGVQIVEGNGSGVDIWLEGGIAYYPCDSLSEQIKDLREGREISNGDLVWSFPSWQAAEDFIGVNLADNPMLDNCPSINYSHKYDDVMGHYLVVAVPDLSAVRTYGCYELGEANIMVESHLFTDRKSPLPEDWDEQFLGYIFPDGTQLDRDTYTAPSGLTAQIMEITHPDKDGASCKAAVSINGIPTVITVSDSPDVHEVLLQVLDGFVLE